MRILIIVAAAAALAGCMSTTRNTADAFYGSLFPGSNAPTAQAR